uniref:ScbA/BarX family gamma-butyrolactone biosynthesis protein n=1 Tax=Streptomyces chartreusis TaxID=1969 RepID=UPI003F499692
MSLGAAHPPLDLGPYVGKTDPTAVLLTRWSAGRDGTYAVTAQWPRVHRYYTLSPERHGPHIFTESVRQALALLAHTAFDVPTSYRLGWEQFTSTVQQDALHTQLNPATVNLAVTYGAIKRRRLGSLHLTASVTATRGENHLGTAQVRYTAHPPTIYDRLRGRYANVQNACARALPAPPPIDASLVSRLRSSDVVLTTADAPRTWRLRADTSHPFLFDHPHDHVPGMLLLEASCQAATAALPALRTVPVGFDATFSHYVELDQPCDVMAGEATPSDQGQHQIQVIGTQNGKEAFSTTVTLDPIKAPPACGFPPAVV